MGSTKVLLSGLVLILAQAVYRAWAIFGGWFHIDDFNFISITTNNPSLSRAVMTNYWGHRMPGAFFMSWVNDHLARWQWWLPASELLILQLVASVGLLALLGRHMGLRRAILIPLALYLFTASTVPSSIWWASAINLLPLSVGLVWALYFHLNYLRSRRLAEILWANLCLIFGLAFSEKTVVVLVAVVLITTCWFAEGRTATARVVDALRRYRAGFIAYGVIALIYGFGYWVSGTMVMVTDQTIPGRFPVFTVLSNMIFRTYLPGLVGGPWKWMYFSDQPHSVADPSTGMMVAAALMVTWVVWHVSRSWVHWQPALLLPIAFILVNASLVSFARVIYVGPFLTREYRYQGELALVTAIALAAMTTRWRGSLSGPAPRSAIQAPPVDDEDGAVPWRLADHPRAVTGLVTLVCLSSVLSGVVYTHHWQGFQQGRSYTLTLAKAAAALPPGTEIADVRVSESLTNAYRFPENTIRHLFRKESHQLTFTNAAIDSLLYPQKSGQLLPITIPTTRQALPGARPRCQYPVRPVSIIMLDGPVAFGGWWVKLAYVSKADTSVLISAGDSRRKMRFPAGSHTAYFSAGDEFTTVTIIDHGAGASRLCVNRLTVGQPDVGDLP